MSPSSSLSQRDAQVFLGKKNMVTYSYLQKVIGALVAYCFITPSFAQTFSSSAGELTVISLAKNLQHLWSLAFLPDGRMLVTERPGRMRIVSKTGQISPPLSGVPAVYAKGQGGLLDLVLAPQFKQNSSIYFCYSEGNDAAAGTAVAKATLSQDQLQDVKVIFQQQPKVKGKNHWGCRIVFDSDNTLFVTLGERFDYSEKAQDLTTDLGKIVHITTEGKPAPNNPFLNQPGALPEIWSYGHRNIQGATLNPQTHALWIVEHGPRGGDEINLIEAGKNYGWPKASYGSHYSFLPILDDHAKQGFIEPLFYWNPSISPSGLLFYTGDIFPNWKGDLFTGALNGQALIHLKVTGDKIIKEERLLQSLNERIRDVVQGPDGLIYLLTDSDRGEILQIGLAQTKK